MLKFAVVPHAGTWIEITKKRFVNASVAVVPHAGTWIEIMPIPLRGLPFRRSPRGNVD